ncbi:MAG: right-handed parallel beta-helix repeat-containing protein [bacterium]
MPYRLLPTYLFMVLVTCSLCSWAVSLQPSLLISPLPSVVRDGDVISLYCDRTYSGTLQLRGKRNIVVRAAPGCPSATITPAVPITGWTKEGKIWSAPVNFEPRMVQVDGLFTSLAHEPNDLQMWLQGEGKGRDRLQIADLGHDLRGATIVWRAEDWLILSETIADYDRGLLRIARLPDENFGFPAKSNFYLEGQRWMLNSPGEWFYEQDRLFIWPENDKSPEGRVWAAPSLVGIDAQDSSNVRIEGITLFLAYRGIDGSNSRSLNVHDTHITNSDEEAILIGGSSARISHVRIDGTVKHGIRANDDAVDVHITDSVFHNVGMLGMAKRSKGVIVFEHAQGQVITRNSIARAGYLGIRVFRDALVDGNRIDRVCLRLTDCGGIYTAARDRQPLRTRIENNRISRAEGRWSYAIYLDDFANDVVVKNNQSFANPSGMQLHNGFSNVVSDNLFMDSTYQHILFNETASFGSIFGNQVNKNKFVSSSGVPVFRLWSGRGGNNLSRFAIFSQNNYSIATDQFAQLEGFGVVGKAEWIRRMGEINSQFSQTGTLPQLPGKR